MNGSSGIVCVVAVGFSLLSIGSSVSRKLPISRPSKYPIPEEMARTSQGTRAKRCGMGVLRSHQRGAPRRRHLLLSFSLPDDTLKDYLREAKLLGAKVLLRGLVQDSFKVTQERIKHLLFTGTMG